MPITSLFLPTEGLQGQDIPSHVLWKDVQYTDIEVKFPKVLELKEIHNVSIGNFTLSENILNVKQVDCDGYLGLLFRSSRQRSNRVDVEVEYSFRKEEEYMYKDAKSIHLFRADISFDPPSRIKILAAKKHMDKGIVLKNLGEGTGIIQIETTSKSEIKKSTPENVREFFEHYVRDLERKLSRLKEKFGDCSELIDNLIDHEKSTTLFGKRSSEEFLKKLFEGLSEKMDSNEDFAKGIIEAYVSSILGNIHFKTIFEIFLDYINSIGRNRILLADPFSVLRIPKGEAILQLEVVCTDLLYNECSRLITPPIEILADKDCDIPIYKLLKWEVE